MFYMSLSTTRKNWTECTENNNHWFLKNNSKLCEARIWQLNCFIVFNRQYFVNWLLFDPSNTSILFWVRKINFLKRQELSIFKVAAIMLGRTIQRALVRNKANVSSRSKTAAIAALSNTGSQSKRNYGKQSHYVSHALNYSYSLR